MLQNIMTLCGHQVQETAIIIIRTMGILMLMVPQSNLNRRMAQHLPYFMYLVLVIKSTILADSHLFSLVSLKLSTV